MTSEKLIHIKLNSSEALQAKRDVLSTERELLEIAKTIKRYQSLRIEELKLKLRLHRKLKELLTNIRNLQKTLPKIEIPKIIKEIYEPTEEVEKTIQKARAIKTDADLEAQLKDIQEKLKELG